MTKNEIKTTLKAWIHDWAIDPADAAELYSEIEDDGLDVGTFIDYLDGMGYPNLAKETLTTTKEAWL